MQWHRGIWPGVACLNAALAGGAWPNLRLPLPPHTFACPACPTCPAVRRSCVPSVFSAEAGLIYAQGLLLVLRTLLSDYVSRLEGRAGRWIIQSNGPMLSKTLGQFVAVSLWGARRWASLWR